MNIHELSPSEVMQIDGSGMAEWVDTGAAIGMIAGYAIQGGLAGASRGGLIGAAGGFSGGLGWGVGTFIYNRFLSPYPMIR
ncbi:hypothetical protein FUT69_00910 [Xylella taiwanensis]|nr:hypothetical protein [Xylella taiwanensis]MCD8456135.1 hypothetical protein [Xylella taiwanensis]MCD8463262.1 hypothetical protein [Xylella taiwanensis]MCD8465181.1 hypothetical protein [Xylella taiwanensis]MCD8467258.1 hypothetical protein [Xylella taiwanensis]MCD8470404.1 hypothetical protein [Xylella taiwanensis]